MAVQINGDGLITVDGTSASQGRVRLAEDTDNGTNYVELTAPASLAANRTVTFSDADINFATGLGAAQGGTGLTSSGANGNVLTSNGTTWTSAAPAAPAALSTASGSAPSYSARAWVNFNGTGAVAIRASGNVTSITDNNVGDYTVNFTTAMSDANYARLATVSGISGQANMCVVGTDRYNTTLNTATTTTTRLYCYINNTAQDPEFVSFAAFR